MSAPDAPVVLPANTLPSFYAGAGRIAAFRGDPAVPATDPEDWVASATARTGMAPRGRTRLPDGTDLGERFAADPQGWFGPGHVARHGDRAALLVKLLDAGQRLPLHVHPDRPFAQAHLGSPYGKTEAWLVLRADPGASVHLGFARDVTAAELAGWVSTQDVAALLDACNRVPVRAGDVLLCPAGVPHAIGAGILVVELQEMTDFSIMLEWDGFPIAPEDVFLGLDAELALSAVRRTAVPESELAGHVLRAEPGITSLLPAAADEFFHAQQIVGEATLDARFAVLIVDRGAGTLTGPGVTEITAGQTLVVSYAAGPLTLAGDVSVLRCFPD
ncbi:class I mannose-6-phosphate isomerase [Actinoplanes friuliensis]|uniref:class I mannose-6-phosphate isomerase n=1 Tax=Actinoplanes friuliensis TaxID=196914 RepID=UPI0004067CBD|nr:class I mannose-6-phosphate isomerase [Actinoplanes friuliensis]